MKKRKFKQKEIKELAESFNEDFKATLPITMLPDGSMAYKQYLIKETDKHNWGIYHLGSKTIIDEYFLKTCALMAAKAYNSTDMVKFFSIKRLDNKYWASYCDTLVYKKNIKTAKDFDRYLILLNKLEHSSAIATHSKDEISKMFKWSFV